MNSKPQQSASMPDSVSIDGSTAHNLTRSGYRGDEHQSYLLRLWRSGGDGGWRASLHSVQTGERHMFADLDSLLAFLVEQSRPPPTG